jgi:hypothetical protein
VSIRTPIAITLGKPQKQRRLASSKGRTGLEHPISRAHSGGYHVRQGPDQAWKGSRSALPRKDHPMPAWTIYGAPASFPPVALAFFSSNNKTNKNRTPVRSVLS